MSAKSPALDRGERKIERVPASRSPPSDASGRFPPRCLRSRSRHPTTRDATEPAQASTSANASKAPRTGSRCATRDVTYPPLLSRSHDVVQIKVGIGRQQSRQQPAHQIGREQSAIKLDQHVQERAVCPRSPCRGNPTPAAPPRESRRRSCSPPSTAKPLRRIRGPSGRTRSILAEILRLLVFVPYERRRQPAARRRAAARDGFRGGIPPA